MVTREPKTEEEFLLYLKKINFKRHLKRIEKKLRGKSVLIYGAGAFFQTLVKEYDLSCLNIIGISDRKFINHENKDVCLGYKVYEPKEIDDLNPDYVLVTMFYFVNIIDDLEENVITNKKIKLKPLINKPIWQVLKEVLS